LGSGCGTAEDPLNRQAYSRLLGAVKWRNGMVPCIDDERGFGAAWCTLFAQMQESKSPSNNKDHETQIERTCA
jgi:hypothetical protein